MKIHDVTMPIYPGMVVYKNKPEKQPAFEVTSDFSYASARETKLHMDVHAGTHVDAPLHMIPDGDTTDSLRLESLVRDCVVIDVTSVQDAIHVGDLESQDIQSGDFVLFKTRNSLLDADTFDFEFVYVAKDAAKWLARRGVRGVGVDGLGVERAQPEHTTHKVLFEAGAIIMEGLRLAEVHAGRYQMVAAPLKLRGLDAAPARVFLIEE